MVWLRETRSGRGGDLQEILDKFPTPGDDFMLQIPTNRYNSPGYEVENIGNSEIEIILFELIVTSFVSMVSLNSVHFKTVSAFVHLDV